jgi:hypothetical protein
MRRNIVDSKYCYMTVRNVTGTWLTVVVESLEPAVEIYSPKINSPSPTPKYQ